MADIILVEGSNELKVQMAPVVVPLPAIGPVSIDAPEVVESGSEFIISHTVVLPYGSNHEYRIALELVGPTKVRCCYIRFCALPTFSRDYPLYKDKEVYTYQCRATAPLPPGTYRILSTGALYLVASYTDHSTSYIWGWTKWLNIDMGTIEVI
ncbi:hypothetical protein ES703_98331 [subsurface metagenome]